MKNTITPYRKSQQTLLDGSWIYKDYTLSLETFIRYLTHAEECPDDLLPSIHGFSWLYDLQKTYIPDARRLARQLVSLWKKHHLSFFGTKGGERVWKNDLTGVRLNVLCQLHAFLISTATETFCKHYHLLKSRHIKKLKNKELDCLKSVTGMLWDDPKMLPVFIDLIGKTKFDSPYQFFLIFRDVVEHSVNFEKELLPVIYQLAPILRFFRHNNGQLARFHHGLSLWDQAFEPHKIDNEDIDALLSPYQAHEAPLSETECFVKCLGFGSSLFVEKTSSMTFEWQSQGVVVKGYVVLCDENTLLRFTHPYQILCEQQSKTDVELALTDPLVLQAFSLKPEGIEGCLESRTSFKTILCFESEHIVLESPQKARIGPFVFYTTHPFCFEDQKIFLPCTSSVLWEICLEG